MTLLILACLVAVSSGLVLQTVQVLRLRTHSKSLEARLSAVEALLMDPEEDGPSDAELANVAARTGLPVVRAGKHGCVLSHVGGEC